jgi:lactate racemase
MIGKGLASGWLEDGEIQSLVSEGLDKLGLSNKRVLVIIPDNTRTMPQLLFFQSIVKNLIPRVTSLGFLVALGTHPPMDQSSLYKMLGINSLAEYGPKLHIYNHEWNNPAALTSVGEIPAEKINEISQGLLSIEVPVRINRLILEHDHIIICGPVFPHEVVGFSGGNKYFFPGSAGPDIINLTHWLGALITSIQMIGVADTPVRQVINYAANLIPRPRTAICSVVEAVVINNQSVPKIAGVYIGSPEEAFIAAAKLSAHKHIVWCKHPYKRILSVLPEMYNELWVGAKGMYKVEPVLADDGEVIIYAPHLNDISFSHGKIIQEIGYHVRDYFTKQWEKFSTYPWSVLAHSTHLRGIGSYKDGIEAPRIKVTLATGIPAEICQKINLGYYNPASIDVNEWKEREGEGILLVPHAGELLFRLRGEKHALPAK